MLDVPVLPKPVGVSPPAGFSCDLGEVAFFAFGRCYCLVSQRFLRPENAGLSGFQVVKKLITLIYVNSLISDFF